ncbi:MAG TPA: protein kinase [Gaiellaceae bacterium]|jgi:YVTN family beta-propeller protein|nr:protein kinase [Gaiellaceae bacterium]
MSVGSDPRVGGELLDYRLEAPIGRGGMGIVYRAYDPRLKRDVALKLLAPEYAADTRFRERFLTETERAASLEHPNVVPIHDAGEVDGQLYLVMRYVDGGDLKRMLAEETMLGPERAIAVCEQVADALDAAHARALVHRDVKPSNVLLDSRGHVYLADFGLSRRLSEQAPGFEAGLSLGTPAYVAPEQIEGKEIDGRADQYSLACVLYECLTGRPPFPRGTEAAVLFAHLEEPPPAPPGVEEVMARGLAKDPAKRYETCSAFVEATRTALGIEQARVRRWPLAVVAIAAIFAAAAAAATALVVNHGERGPAALPGADRALRIDPESNSVTDSAFVGRQTTGIAVGRNVWVASFGDGELWRLDPHTHDELRVSTQGSPTDLALTGSVAVAANGPQHTLAYADEDTGTIGDVEVLPGPGIGVIQVASGKNGLWLDDPSVGSVRRDPRAGTGPIAIPSAGADFEHAYRAFGDIAVGFGSVWVLGDTFERTIWRIDTRRGRIVATVPLPFVPGQLAAGDQGVWVTSLLGDSVAHVDPTTNRVAATVPVAAGPVAVAVGKGSVWVASSIGAAVTRIDALTNRVLATIPIDGRPEAIAVGPAGVWLAARDRAPALPAGTIRIGVLTDCTGSWGFARDHTLAGAELPLIERGARRASGVIGDGVVGSTLDGHPLDVRTGCSDGTTSATLAAARRLVEEEGSTIVIGPVTGDEGLALQDYARRHPDVVFVNGSSSSRQRNPARNFFSFHTDGVQWMAGVGSYAYRDLGWRRAFVIATADSFSWAQSAGFTAEFCSLGGTTKQIWVRAGTDDYSRIVARLPREGVDGFVVVSDPHALVALANGYPGLPGNLSRNVVGGTNILDDKVLERLKRRTAGIVVGEPIQFASHDPYTKRMTAAFPRLPRFLIGTSFDLFYYGAVKASLDALDEVNGDVRNTQALMNALARVELALPQGRTAVDRNRQGIAPNYLVKLGHGKNVLPPSVFRTIPRVERTFGGYLNARNSRPSKATPDCIHGDPPPWARS